MCMLCFVNVFFPVAQLAPGSDFACLSVGGSWLLLAVTITTASLIAMYQGRRSRQLAIR